MRDYFFGWYFKNQSADRTLAVIPAWHRTGGRTTCSIQIITDEQAWFADYPGEKFIRLKGGFGATIGGNHLIHAARRNINVTAIVSNNYNYGQTGGQYSATTPTHSITQTSPYGHVEKNFDLCKLAIAAGASYVGRTTAFNPVLMRQLIKEGMQVRGFSLIEVISACPTHYGKFNKLGEASRMMKLMNERSVTVAQAAKMTDKELEDKIVVGCMKNEPRDDYYTEYARIIEAHRIK